MQASPAAAGFGLAISKAIIEEHGGSIGVQCDLDQGSLFWFTLPKASADTDDDVDELD